MLNRVNVKYAVDLIASVSIIIACALVVFVGLNSRRTADANEPTAKRLDAVEDITEKRLRMSIADAPVLGEASAPISLVEFSDFECPFCRQFAMGTFEELKRQFI